MSQLAVRPGRNAARQAKRLKEVRKVKGAIQWHERERKKRQEIKQERWESKQAVIQRLKWEQEHIKDVKKQGLANAKQDWQLGPLRPNRAIGEGADKYGALTSMQMQKPEIPTRTQKNRNAYRERQGLELEYPLVVDDKKYFPIVKGDRVVVLKGKEKGKIGVVSEVIGRTHELIIKGVNMQYYDSSVFSAASEEMGPKHPNEVPIPLADVRLVVPYELTQQGVKGYSDVIVEKIFMERHTTGIDPFTGTDYGDAEIPEKHQYDPLTGLPIFHRYIAATRLRIEWPWEREQDIEVSGVTKASPRKERQTWFSTIRHPITSLKRWRGQNKETSDASPTTEKSAATEIESFERREMEKLKARPRSQDLDLAEAYDNVDTTRNIVEGAESMSYTLVAPPFPNTLGEELRGDIHDFSIETRKDPEAQRRIKIKRTTEAGVVAREVAKEKHYAAEKMKTPMQLRWELEHAKKLSDRKKSPLVDTDSLLMALGQHMQKKGVKPKRSQAVGKVEDLD